MNTYDLQREVGEGLLVRGDAAGRLVPDAIASLVIKSTQRTHHYKRHLQRRVSLLLAGARFYEVRAALID